MWERFTGPPMQIKAALSKGGVLNFKNSPHERALSFGVFN
jgi:hypothetical protein